MSRIIITEMTCRRHDVRSSIADIAVGHELREVEEAFRGGGARGRFRRNVMVMVVVIGLASHGSRGSMDHRRGLWCRQQSHSCMLPGTRDEALLYHALAGESWRERGIGGDLWALPEAGRGTAIDI